VLVGLYEEPERPPNAVDYIKRYMGAPTGIDVEALRAECEHFYKEKNTIQATKKKINKNYIFFFNLIYSVVISIYFCTPASFASFRFHSWCSKFEIIVTTHGPSGWIVLGEY
jgi:hypothetical protein